MKEDLSPSSKQQSAQSEHNMPQPVNQKNERARCKLSSLDNFSHAEPLSEDESNELYKANKKLCRRQKERVKKITIDLDSIEYTGTAGRARFLIGVAIFISALTICYLSGPPESTNKTLILELRILRPIVITLCIIGALLILTASKRHRAFRYIFSVLVIACGWAAPRLWEMNQLERSKQILKEEKINSEIVPTIKPLEIQLAFQSKNLTQFTELCNRRIEERHIAFFITGTKMSQRRDIIDIINRFSKTKNIHAYTKKDGLLLICENITKDCKNPRDIAALFGDIVAEDSNKGIYGISYQNDIAQLENSYSSSILSTPRHVSYVEANLAELQSKVSSRVRRAATSLRRINAPHLRRDIEALIYSVLQDPWENETLTQSALISALVHYAEPGDKKVSDIALRYIQSANFRKNEESLIIIKYLVNYIPEEATQIIITKWKNNPIGWNDQLIALGALAQDALTLQLNQTDQNDPKNILIINSILNYLNAVGTSTAIPSILPYKKHKDTLIRSKAESSINSITGREQSSAQNLEQSPTPSAASKPE